MSRVEIEYDSKPLRGHLKGSSVEFLSTKDDEAKRCELVYLFDTEAGMWCIDDMRVPLVRQRQGIGGQLLREFSRRVGPGQKVYGAIDHTESRMLLYSRYGESVGDGELEIPSSDLEDLPIAGLFEKGRIAVDHVSMRKASEEELADHPDVPYYANIYGTTVSVEGNL